MFGVVQRTIREKILRKHLTYSALEFRSLSFFVVV